MTEFWENSFREKNEMWGDKPADSAFAAADLFKQERLNRILIPGFGYGRNAEAFIGNGCAVTGIEISKTAIELARKKYGNSMKIYHGQVYDMPFDQETYDAVYCYALIHLLDEPERRKLISDCFSQLPTGGYLFFITISKFDSRYGQGEKIGDDHFETRHGVRLFFYDQSSVQTDFGAYGLLSAEEISEPARSIHQRPQQKFMQIICKKE